VLVLRPGAAGPDAQLVELAEECLGGLPHGQESLHGPEGGAAVAEAVELQRVGPGRGQLGGQGVLDLFGGKGVGATRVGETALIRPGEEAR